ncbi:MAG: hypothetical protein ACI8RD_002768 [Bacillariaceae sp.]|jgi:hypothetical protein
MMIERNQQNSPRNSNEIITAALSIMRTSLVPSTPVAGSSREQFSPTV